MFIHQEHNKLELHVAKALINMYTFSLQDKTLSLLQLTAATQQPISERLSPLQINNTSYDRVHKTSQLRYLVRERALPDNSVTTTLLYFINIH